MRKVVELPLNMTDPKSLRQKEAVPGFAGKSVESFGEQTPSSISINNFQTPHARVPHESASSLETIREEIKTMQAPDYDGLLPGAIGIPSGQK